MGSGSADMGRLVLLPGRAGSEPWVTKAQLAAHLQVHEKSIERQVARGMPCFRVGKRTVRFRISVCEAWLEAQT